MDGRIFPVKFSAWWIRSAIPTLSVGALSLAAGCTHLREAADSAAAEAPIVVKEENLPKRMPKAFTCVNLADLRMQMSLEEGRTPIEVERFREEARRSYHQAMKIDAKCSAAYLGLARLYEQAEEFDKAQKALEQGIAACPKEASICYELGMLQARRKDWDHALVNLKKASKLDPEKNLYVNAIGFTLARAGRVEESYRHFEHCFGAARAHYNVARVLHHMQKDDESKRHVRLALQAKPNWDLARHFLDELEHPERANKAIATVSFEVEPHSAGPSATAQPVPDNSPRK